MKNFSGQVFPQTIPDGSKLAAWVLIQISLCPLLLAVSGCQLPVATSPTTPFAAPQVTAHQNGILKPNATNTPEAAFPQPTPSATQAVQITPTTVDWQDLLQNALTHLTSAKSLEVDERTTRAYRIVLPDRDSQVVFGDFHNHYAIISTPKLKVRCWGEYRYDPSDEFIQFDSYTVQNGGFYHTTLIETSSISTNVETDYEKVAPFSSDVFQTLLNYSDQALFLEENEGIAVYQLTHPAWYQLRGAIGFADLGFLAMQEQSDLLLEQYAADHYPAVRPILFTIYILIKEQQITRVELDDSEFMISVWEAVTQALIDQGATREELPRYEVLDTNRTVITFENHNQVPEFEPP